MYTATCLSNPLWWHRYWVGEDILPRENPSSHCTNEDGFLPGEIIPCTKSVSANVRWKDTHSVYETHPITGKIFGAHPFIWFWSVVCCVYARQLVAVYKYARVV